MLPLSSVILCKIKLSFLSIHYGYPPQCTVWKFFITRPSFYSECKMADISFGEGRFKVLLCITKLCRCFACAILLITILPIWSLAESSSIPSNCRTLLKAMNAKFERSFFYTILLSVRYACLIKDAWLACHDLSLKAPQSADAKAIYADRRIT